MFFLPFNLFAAATAATHRRLHTLTSILPETNNAREEGGDA